MLYPAYISKHNLNHEKPFILLMIPNRERWYYITVKKLAALLRGITSKNNSDFYCLKFLHSFRTKEKLEPHQNECENKDVYGAVMPSDDIKTLEFNQYQNLITHYLLFMQIISRWLKK